MCQKLMTSHAYAPHIGPWDFSDARFGKPSKTAPSDGPHDTKETQMSADLTSIAGIWQWIFGLMTTLALATVGLVLKGYDRRLESYEKRMDGIQADHKDLRTSMVADNTKLWEHLDQWKNEDRRRWDTLHQDMMGLRNLMIERTAPRQGGD
jgi:hypothetical protein